MTIGAHGVWTPDAARKEARRLAHLVDQGVDPLQSVLDAKRERVDLAFPKYADLFRDEYLRPTWKGGYDIAEGLLRREIVPHLRDKSLVDVTRKDVAQLLDRLADRPGARRNAFAVIRRLFRWAVNRGDIPGSPISDMEAPKAPAARERVLSDEELVRVWRAAEAAAHMASPFVKLLILTGQRRNEVASMSWEELDRKAALWTIPGERAKNGNAHDVPLSPAVMDLVDGLAGGSKWPANGYVISKAGAPPLRTFGTIKSRIDKLLLAQRSEDGQSLSAPKHWRFHDLRRTMATGFQRLGVRFEVTEAVLNHLSGSRSGIAGVYQRHNWAEEKRAALELWSQHISSLLYLQQAHQR